MRNESWEPAGSQSSGQRWNNGSTISDFRIKGCAETGGGAQNHLCLLRLKRGNEPESQVIRASHLEGCEGVTCEGRGGKTEKNMPKIMGKKFLSFSLMFCFPCTNLQVGRWSSRNLKSLTSGLSLACFFLLPSHVYCAEW